MLLDKEKEKIYCFICQKWYDIYKIFLHVFYEGSITCDKDHIIGNECDSEWIEYWEYKNENIDK